MNENEEIKSIIPAKWVCIAFNDTKWFNIQEEDKPYIKQIDSIYFYDENERSFCCSATPLYFMRALHHSVHFNYDAFDPKTEAEIQERISVRYEIDCQAENCYMDIVEVNRVDAKQKHFYGPTDDTEDEVREYYQGNHVV